MCSLQEFFSTLDGLAPISLSHKLIELGDYDNSGILVHSTNTVKKALFTLDLSDLAVDFAIKNGCDTIVTHHPAIYAPIKSLSQESASEKALVKAIKANLNVISMHLNLDVAVNGIDQSLAEKLCAKEVEILEKLVKNCGYGRQFIIEETTLKEYYENVKVLFNCNKILCYGKEDSKIKSVASFCGSGSSTALKLLENGCLTADLIITSDMPHHALKELLEVEKRVILIPHYVAEEYGFSKYFANVNLKLKNKIETIYFLDERFK
ncbi:MAG: Nif3-like dinuclear metal center hexameric protein [Clostridia bacterium]|nr:Nif3-like dinuclear metal center hexameric protein [Clostridia bacterium]